MTAKGLCGASMAMALGFEDMGAAQVAAWLRDELKLPRYAPAAEEDEVDGETRCLLSFDPPRRSPGDLLIPEIGGD